MPAGHLLDPSDIEDGWFELHQPFLQLTDSNTIPDEIRDRAENVPIRQRLRDDERVVRQRREWFRLHQDREISRDGLEGKAPRIAAPRLKSPEW